MYDSANPCRKELRVSLGRSRRLQRKSETTCSPWELEASCTLEKLGKVGGGPSPDEYRRLLSPRERWQVTVY